MIIGCFVTDYVTVGQPNPLTLSLEPTYDKGVDLFFDFIMLYLVMGLMME